MKKKLIIFLVVLFVLIGGGATFILYNLNSILSSLKPQIETTATTILQTPVTLGDISASIFPKTTMSIDKVSLGENEERFELKNVSVAVELWPLLSKELKVTELTLKEPNIIIVKDASGMKIPGAPKSKGGNSQGDVSVQGSHSPSLNIHLDKISVKDGTLIFDDQVAQKKYSLSDIDIESALGFDGVKGELTQVQFSAKVLDGSVGTATSDKISFELGKNFNAQGKLALKNFGGTFGAFSASDLSAHVDASIKTAKQTANIENLQFNLNGSPVSGTVQAEISPETMSTPRLDLNLLGGSISAPVTLTVATSNFSTPLTIKSLDIEKSMLFLQGGGESKLYGTITNVTGNVAGTLGANLKNSLNGSLSVTLNNGGIKGVNLGGMSLKEIKDIPLVSGALFTYVPEGYRAALQSENTEFSSLTGSVSFSGGRIHATGMKMISPLYSIDADGDVGFDSSVDLDATITFTKEFSDGLVAATPGFKRILSADGRLVFPLTIKGTLPKVIVVPNLMKVLEVAGTRLIQDKAAEVLEKALGGKGKGKGLGGLLGW